MRVGREFMVFAVVWLAWHAGPVATASSVSVRFAEGVATVKTDRYEIAWENGSMVGLRTALPRGQNITIDAHPMRFGDLPNGLAVVADRSRDMLKTYDLISGFPLSESYPAYHPPVSGATGVSCERIDGGVRLTYRNLAGAAEAVLVQELTVEARTGDLIIRQRGMHGPASLALLSVCSIFAVT